MSLVRIKGTTKRNKGNGRKLGYPTANIQSATRLKDGVYFGFASLASYQRWPALIFIGTPTTLGDKTRRVEAHLLDIEDEDYYGLDIQIEPIHFHRPNQTFDSTRNLVSAMKRDEIAGRKWFKSQKK